MGYKGSERADSAMICAPFPHPDTYKERNNMITESDVIEAYHGKTTSDSGQVNTPNYVPDPKMHLVVSLVKSGIRIFGYSLLLGIHSHWAVAAAIVLIASEAVGIYEELV